MTQTSQLNNLLILMVPQIIKTRQKYLYTKLVNKNYKIIESHIRLQMKLGVKLLKKKNKYHLKIMLPNTEGREVTRSSSISLKFLKLNKRVKEICKKMMKLKNKNKSPSLLYRMLMIQLSSQS